MSGSGNRYAMIMAGGSGTRLWPMSRADRPKQFIPFIAGRTLLQVAADRLDGLVGRDRVYVCTAEEHRGIVRDGLEGVGDEQILGEPCGRNTLPAVGFTAAVLCERDPDAVFAVFTADHLIQPVDVFGDCVRKGFEIAEQLENSLVTFGIKPTHAATGYGYVKVGEGMTGVDGAWGVERFVEKPDVVTAEGFLSDGGYLWNSGMFVWRAQTLLDCIGKYKPELYEGLMKIAAAWNDGDRVGTLERVYPTLEKISVDYGVMEPASADADVTVATVGMEVDWLDVGAWPAYGETVEVDGEGNRVVGRAAMVDSRENLVVCEDESEVVGLVGVEGLVVVRSGGRTLICSKAAAEQIKDLHERIGAEFGAEWL